MAAKCCQQLFDPDLPVVQVLNGETDTPSSKHPAQKRDVYVGMGNLIGIQIFTACHRVIAHLHFSGNFDGKPRINLPLGWVSQFLVEVLAVPLICNCGNPRDSDTDTPGQRTGSMIC